MNTEHSLPFITRIAYPRAVTLNVDCYAAKYVAPGYRTPTREEIETRSIAQDLKVPTEAAIKIAFPLMARLIDGPCWLVPVPASDATLRANLALCRAIADLVSGARVKCAVGRARPVESSQERRVCGLSGLTIEQHCIVRTCTVILA